MSGTIFGKSHKVVLTMNADNLPTAIASATEVGLVEGVLAHVMSSAQADTVVTGGAKTLGHLAEVYGGMQLGRVRAGLGFAWNPF